MTHWIDLRSDTVTTPTPEMRRAMAEAEVGDDVFREDPTVRILEETAAGILEKEAALFLPTGTMGNQVAIKLHTMPGQEVITEARAHVFNYELAMMAAFSGCLARPVSAPSGLLRWDLIEPHLSPPIYYKAQSGLICLENSHNMAGGTVQGVDEINGIVEQAHKRGLPVHMDGARIFNAAMALGVRVADLARGCDSVMFCLSKGLAAPVGSLLVGSREFIEEAWRVRKMLGGGMRQVGILAAAGLIAVEQMPERLLEDHENARILAEGLSELRSFEVNPLCVQTNIIITDLNGISSDEALRLLKEENVLAVPTGPSQLRFVTHKDVNRETVLQALGAIRKVFR